MTLYYKPPTIRLQQTAEESLYNRLGGIFAIAAVINLFSDRVLAHPVVGVDSPNPQLREWSRSQAGARLPGLKFQRTLWVAAVSGGPQVYVPTKPGTNTFDLTMAHRDLKISLEEFDTVASVLAATMTDVGVSEGPRNEVLAAFNGHKTEVTAGYTR